MGKVRVEIFTRSDIPEEIARKEAINQKQRKTHNKKAEKNLARLERALKAIDSILTTLQYEIDERAFEVSGEDAHWQMEQSDMHGKSPKRESPAIKGYNTSLKLDTLCRTVKVGLEAIIGVADMGFNEVGEVAMFMPSESRTAMAACVNSPNKTTRLVDGALWEMKFKNLGKVKEGDDAEEPDEEGGFAEDDSIWSSEDGEEVEGEQEDGGSIDDVDEEIGVMSLEDQTGAESHDGDGKSYASRRGELKRKRS